MGSRQRRGPAAACLRAASWPLRVLARAGWILFVAVLGAFGSPPPRFVRQEDDIVQVATEEVQRE
jgi:hypothetical protein